MIDFPVLPSGEMPAWDGRQFLLGDRSSQIISYSSNDAGWNDDLTELHEQEAGHGQHPLDLASRRTAIAALRRFGFPSDGTLLEVGCSSGFLLRDLKREFPDAQLAGTDVAGEALRRLAESLTSVPLIQMDLLDCPLPEAQFDAIVAINVLEHIEDDCRALQVMRGLLKPSGILVIEVPNGQRLYDYYDRYLHHFRRYSTRDLSWKIVAAGLCVEWTGFLGFIPYLPFWIVKKTNRIRFGERGEKAPNLEALVRENIRTTSESRVLRAMLAIERLVSGLVAFPAGIRCVAVARAPKANSAA